MRPGFTTAQAVGDGEDYELLVTFRPDDRERAARLAAEHFPETPLTVIGEMTAETASALPQVTGTSASPLRTGAEPRKTPAELFRRLFLLFLPLHIRQELFIRVFAQITLDGTLRRFENVHQDQAVNTSPKCLSTLKERILPFNFRYWRSNTGMPLAILFYISDQLGQPLGICQPQREDA